MTKEHVHQVITHLEKQLSDRLEKLWKVFNWSGGILIAITGGMVLLGQNQDIVSDSSRYIASTVILILTVYAYLWIKENLKFENKIRDQLESIFDKELNYPKLKELRPDKAILGYKLAILLLGSTALIATWIRF